MSRTRRTHTHAHTRKNTTQHSHTRTTSVCVCVCRDGDMVRLSELPVFARAHNTPGCVCERGCKPDAMCRVAKTCYYYTELCVFPSLSLCAVYVLYVCAGCCSCVLFIFRLDAHADVCVCMFVCGCVCVFWRSAIIYTVHE